MHINRTAKTIVALRKESVDRNTQRRDFKSLNLPVALRKESVDRNSGTAWVREFPKLSLSARRAWIEILYYGDDLTFAESLSARRAWIEIFA